MYPRHADSLQIAEKLAQRDPNNMTWQIDLVVSLYNLASVADTASEPGRAAARARYGQALTLLRHLEAKGRLPPDRQEWLAAIEARLKALGE